MNLSKIESRLKALEAAAPKPHIEYTIRVFRHEEHSDKVSHMYQDGEWVRIPPELADEKAVDLTVDGSRIRVMTDEEYEELHRNEVINVHYEYPPEGHTDMKTSDPAPMPASEGDHASEAAIRPPEGTAVDISSAFVKPSGRFKRKQPLKFDRGGYRRKCNMKWPYPINE